MQFQDCGDIDSAYNDSEGHSQPSSIYFPEEKQQTMDSQRESRIQFLCEICRQQYSCQASLDLHMRIRHRQQTSRSNFSPKQYSSQFGHQQQQQPSLSRPFGNRHDSTESVQKQSQKKICEQCGSSFSGKTSLRAHIKRKHPEWKEGLVVPPHPHTKSKTASVQCPICGTTCPSKAALEIHHVNKHHPNGALRRPPNQSLHAMPVRVQEDEGAAVRVQKCGCGHIYSSRSALNLHVRKKHGGVYPEGTTKRLPCGKAPREIHFNKQVEDYLRAQRSASEESIYDSDSEDLPKRENDNETLATKKEEAANSPPPAEAANQAVKAQGPAKYKAERQLPYEQLKPMGEPSQVRELHKPFKCGCGKTYTVSSSLNLHIKKSHNWVIPLGTIGGPRGLMGGEDEGELIKQHNIFHEGQSSIICSECGEPSDNSYFKCRTCLNHLLCSTCFWATNNFSKEHDWIVRDR